MISLEWLADAVKVWIRAAREERESVKLVFVLLVATTLVGCRRGTPMQIDYPSTRPAEKRRAQIRQLGSMNVNGTDYRFEVGEFDSPYVLIHFPDLQETKNAVDAIKVTVTTASGKTAPLTPTGFPSPVGERSLGFQLPLDADKAVKVMIRITDRKAEFVL